MNLEQIRAEIDEVNEGLTDLLVRRMKLVAEVAEYKHENNLAVYNPAREQSILNQVMARAGEYAPYARTLFITLMQMSKQNEYATFCQKDPPKVMSVQTIKKAAVQGIAGAYSHQAAAQLYPEAEILFFPDWESVFLAVQEGKADIGVLPAENSSAGSVVEISELLVKYNFHIKEACSLGIGHSLLVKPGLSMQGIRKVLSHPQALNQCREYLAKTLPGAELIAVSNTAEAAKMVAEGEDGWAAIASGVCAELYGLDSLAENIAPQNNRTRFFAVSPQSGILPGADKVSILFSLPHVEGSLFGALVPFACAGLNLTKLESRPFRGRDFEYKFFVDFMGSLSEPSVMAVIDMFRQELPELRVLGNYTEHRF